MIITSWKVKGIFKADAQKWVSAAVDQADMADIKSVM